MPSTSIACDSDGADQIIPLPVDSVGMNVGARRCFVACSYAYAILIRAASLYARPKKEIPTGRLCVNPAGTVMCG